ncbi:MAG TPA: hypothetical protein VIL20_07950 [Sandaracinaceae bacterium]
MPALVTTAPRPGIGLRPVEAPTKLDSSWPARSAKPTSVRGRSRIERSSTRWKVSVVEVSPRSPMALVVAITSES